MSAVQCKGSPATWTVHLLRPEFTMFGYNLI